MTWKRLIESGRALRANVAALVVLASVVLGQAYLSTEADTEAARLRNALLLRHSSPGDFTWTPDRVPTGFRAETRAPSASFVEIARKLQLASLPSDWDRARAIGVHLTSNSTDGGAVQRDLDTTYHAIVDGGRGYCVDFTTVFMGIAHAAGVPVRQWAFSFDGFGGDGHAFVEVYDRKRGKWLFLDVFNNFYATDRATGEPLSALEFRDALRGARPPAAMVPIGPGRPGFVIEQKAWDYYARGLPEWYLWFGNDVFSYDEQPLLRALGHVSRSLQQGAALLMGAYPTIRVIESDANAPQVHRLERLRVVLLGVAVLYVLLLVLLVLQVRARLRAPPKPQAPARVDAPPASRAR